MLSQAQNQLLTQTGPGTPLGELYRRYWIPALLSEEIPTPDGPPARVRLLGEKLVAFRDSQGRIGLIDEHCPHRGTAHQQRPKHGGTNMLTPRKLGHVGIYVKDLEISKRFYAEVVGLKVSDEFPGKAVFMRCGHDHHDTVLFQLAADKLDRSHSDRAEVQQIAYEVDRLDDLRQKAPELKAQGIEVTGPQQRGPGMDKTIDFHDPDGNTIQFYCDMDQTGWDDRSRPTDQWQRRAV